MAGTVRLEKDKTRPNPSELRLEEPGVSSLLPLSLSRARALLTFNFVSAEKVPPIRSKF